MMKKNYKGIKKNGGAAMLISIIFFLFLSLSIIAGLVAPSVREFRVANVNMNSKKSFFLAESGAEDAVYRIRNNMTIGNSETITIGSDSVTTNITSTANSKTIESLGDISSYERKITVSLTTAAGIAFNYGLQAGDGGVTMDGGSMLVGNVYSNGDINAISATVTGSAVAANSAAVAADQANDTPLPPTSSINFRNVAASQDFAQSFQLSSATPLNKIQLYIRKVGSPANATVRVVADNNGSPSTTAINVGTATLTAGLVSTSYGWVEVVFPVNPSLVPDTTYWFVIDNGSQSSSNYYVIGANNSYANGDAKTGAYSGSWNATSLDSYFKVYTGGATSLIGGASYVGGLVVGTAGVGDAWAETVRGVSVQGNLYCTTGTNNNKSCNTTHGTPSPQPLPFSESNINDWKTDAAAGGTISGNYTVGSSGGTLGPKKITGNLTVNGGGILTLTGPIWVEGIVTLSGGGKIKLPANYAQNSETIVADSYVTIGGGGSLGSGESGSYLFIVSTSRCPNDINCSGTSAINVTGGAGAIAVYAGYGNVALNGGATLKSAVGNSLTLSGGTVVTYDEGLASPSFTSGPSGQWAVSGWKESQ